MLIVTIGSCIARPEKSWLFSSYLVWLTRLFSISTRPTISSIKTQLCGLPFGQPHKLFLLQTFTLRLQFSKSKSINPKNSCKYHQPQKSTGSVLVVSIEFQKRKSIIMAFSDDHRDLNLEATELRLGLPGTNEDNQKSMIMDKNKQFMKINNKRSALVLDINGEEDEDQPDQSNHGDQNNPSTLSSLTQNCHQESPPPTK